MSFDDIKNKVNSLGMGEFMKFWNDFKVPVEKYLLKKTYVTNSSDSRSLQLDQFKTAVVQLFRSDMPQRQPLSLRLQKQRNKVLNSSRSKGSGLQKSGILPNIRK